MNEALLGHLYLTFERPETRVSLEVKPVVPLEVAGVPVNPEPLALAASEQPRVTLDSLGGFTQVKDELRETIEALRRPDVMEAYGLPVPNGIFLYGPAGTGKTTLAEALANELGAELQKVTSDQIYDMWVGKSGKNLQEIFDKALETKVPLVLLFDEIDSILHPKHSGSHQEVAGLFKQQIGELSRKNKNIIVVATSNLKPDDIDSALFRPGRFDKHIYVPLPNQADRQAIFGKLMVDFTVNTQRKSFAIEDVNLEKLANSTDEMTTADIVTIITNSVRSLAKNEIRAGNAPEPLKTEDVLRDVASFRQHKA